MIRAIHLVRIEPVFIHFCVNGVELRCHVECHYILSSCVPMSYSHFIEMMICYPQRNIHLESHKWRHPVRNDMVIGARQ